MKVYVATVGTYDDGAVPVGVYKSVKNAMLGLRQYVEANGSTGDYYEVWEYKMGNVLNHLATAQETVCFGEIKDLL